MKIIPKIFSLEVTVVLVFFSIDNDGVKSNSRFLKSVVSG
nr:MAG TPA: hypothetical protein [Bacteriophage sp.]